MAGAVPFVERLGHGYSLRGGRTDGFSSKREDFGKVYKTAITIREGRMSSRQGD